VTQNPEKCPSDDRICQKEWQLVSSIFVYWMDDNNISNVVEIYDPDALCDISINSLCAVERLLQASEEQVSVMHL